MQNSGSLFRSAGNRDCKYLYRREGCYAALLPPPSQKKRSACGHELHTAPTPHFQGTFFLAARARYKDLRRTFPSLGPHKKILNRFLLFTTKIFIPLMQSKRCYLRLTLRPNPWLKTGIQKMRFQQALDNYFCRKSPPPNHLQLEHFKILKKHTFRHFPN